MNGKKARALRCANPDGQPPRKLMRAVRGLVFCGLAPTNAWVIVGMAGYNIESMVRRAAAAVHRAGASVEPGDWAAWALRVPPTDELLEEIRVLLTKGEYAVVQHPTVLFPVVVRETPSRPQQHSAEAPLVPPPVIGIDR